MTASEIHYFIMRIFSFPNLSQAYTTHRYRKDERGTVIKVIGLNEAGSAVVDEVQAADGGMIDEFVHVRARAPEPNATRYTAPSRTGMSASSTRRLSMRR